MPVLPPTKVAKIQFCEQHLDPFNTNAVAIGTTVHCGHGFADKKQLRHARRLMRSVRHTMRRSRQRTISIWRLPR